MMMMMVMVMVMVMVMMVMMMTVVVMTVVVMMVTMMATSLLSFHLSLCLFWGPYSHQFLQSIFISLSNSSKQASIFDDMFLKLVLNQLALDLMMSWLWMKFWVALPVLGTEKGIWCGWLSGCLCVCLCAWLCVWLYGWLYGWWFCGWFCGWVVLINCGVPSQTRQIFVHPQSISRFNKRWRCWFLTFKKNSSEWWMNSFVLNNFFI